MTKKNHIQRVHIWDDPESRINFLETTLGDKEWEAVIYEPVESGTGRLPSLKKELEQKNYRTKLGKDTNGIPTLTITHFNHETSLLKTFGELGLTAGIRQTFETSRGRIGDILTGIKSKVDFFMGSEARRFSTLYAFGDIALGTLPNLYSNFSGDKTPKAKTAITGTIDKFKDKNKTANSLYDRAYDLALVQSLVMMFGMKEGKELIAEEMKQGLSAAQQKGIDLSDFDNLMPEIKDRRSTAKKWFNDTAVYTGSGAQILGQLILIVSGLMRLRNTKAFLNENKDIKLNTGVNIYDQLGKAKLGAIGDVTTGSLSVAGWTLMGFFKEQAITNKVDWSENFFKRAGQEIKSSPNTLASVCVTLASLVGMKAGDLKHSVKHALEEEQKWEHNRLNISKSATGLSSKNLDALATAQSKNKKSGFNKQYIGNGIYLIGDMTVALTKNRNYEAGQIANIEAMASTAIGLLDNMPIAFGESGKDEFITKLSNYMAKRLDNLHDPKNPRPEEYAKMDEQERLNRFAQQIRNEIISKLPEVNQKFEAIAERASDIVLQFGHEQKEAVKQALATELEKSQMLSATKDEIINAIDKTLQNKGAVMQETSYKSKTVLPQNIKKPLAALVNSLPGPQTAQEAMDLYAAVQPFISRSQSHDAEKFAKQLDTEELAKTHPRINSTPEAGVGSSLS
ncbi:MAG: hypothetical protein P8P30_10440 [Rickettsiales bacterium]|nr:hypothetical protein [Rickettsiales bacterium]